MPLKIGDPAPSIELPGDGGQYCTLDQYRGQKIIVYFYPKDDTPGCTTEACEFRDQLRAFNQINAFVLGISRDSLKSHDKFKAKYGLTFPLLSDEEGVVCQAYETWIEKSMYGKKYFGIERSTFLIDEAGIIRQIWRKVRVDGHVQEVLKALKEI